MRRLAVGFAVLGLLAGCESAFVRPEATIDTTLALKLKARRLADQAPAPAWQTVVKHPEVDDWIPVGEHHVLLGMRELTAGRLVTTSRVVTPTFGPYVLYDARSGRASWGFQRKAEHDGFYTAIPTPRALVVQQGDEKGATLTGLDPISGKQLWTRSFSPRPAIAASAQDNLLLVAPAGPGGGVAAFDLSTGSSRWAAALPLAADAQPFLDVSGGQVLVVHRDAASIATKSGSILWVARGVGPLAASSTPRRLHKGVVLAAADGRLSLLRDGKLSWQSALGGRTRKLACSQAACYAEIEDGAGKSSLVAVDLERGRRLWDQELADKLSSSIHVGESALLFTDRRQLASRDLASGNRRFAAPLPVTRAARLADRLFVDQEKVVVAMENGVGAYRLSDLGEIWSYRVRGQGGDLYEDVRARLDSALAPPPQAKNQAEARQKFDAWHSRFERSVTDGMSAMYEGMVDSAASAAALQTGGLNLGGGRVTGEANTGMGRAAVARLEHARAAQARFERDRSIRELTRAIESAGGDVLTAALVEYGRKAEREATLLQLSARVDAAIKTHERAVLGRYYVRPFAGGSVVGVLLVDLVDGTWCEVPTSPSESSEAAGKFLDSNPALVTGSTLIAKGIGFDPARWERDERYRSVITVHRSILGYDVGKLSFKPASAYEKQSLAR